MREILARETPGEGCVERGIALTEGKDSGSEIAQRGAVIRGKHLTLED